MADYLSDIECGKKKYYLSHTGKDIFFSSSSKTSGTKLKGAKFVDNQIVKTSNSKKMSDFDICQAIEKSRSSSGGCFITTAVCYGMNKPDDCYELETLRQFRDTVMLNDSSWEKLVEEYYEIAPDIAKKIDEVEESQIIKIYNEYITPCIELIESRKYNIAIEHYKSMVKFVRSI